MASDDFGHASQAPRRPAFRVLWQVIVVAPVLFTGGSAIKAGLGAIFVQCRDEKTDLPSPDGKHVAHRRVHICEGPLVVNGTVRQIVDVARADADGMARVYDSHEDTSKLRWENNDHLRVDLDTVATIGLSLHQGNGVQVAYHVPRRLVSMQRREELERQADQAHRAGRMSDADYATSKNVDRELRPWGERFIQWASENAIIDDDVK